LSFVVDASAVGCWCFPDESAVLAEIALERLNPDGAVVPALWWFEVRNLLIANERRGRIDPAGTATFLAHLARLPITIDRAPDGAMVMALVRAHGLTVYDAAYLELALRLAIPPGDPGRRPGRRCPLRRRRAADRVAPAVRSNAPCSIPTEHNRRLPLRRLPPR